MDSMKSFSYILTIAASGSISEAAESLGIAQSALSRYLMKVEKDIGIEIFDRSTLPLSLTEAGSYYVEAGKQILKLGRQLEKRIADINNHKNLEIRIGTGPSRSPTLMPLILSEFSSLYPDVHVLMEECRSSELAERLKDGKLDLIISFLDQDTANFDMVELFQETVELAVPQNYQQLVDDCMQDGLVDVRKLCAPFISLHEGQQLRNALDILSRGIIKPLYTCEYQESVMTLVGHGFGVALVPTYWKQIDATSKLKYFPLIVPAELNLDEINRLMSVIHRRIGIFYRKEQYLTDAERSYIASAKRVCKLFNE